MKKLLSMILMLGISLPIFSKEVILHCEYKDEVFGFDEDTGKVFDPKHKLWEVSGWYSRNVQVGSPSSYNYTYFLDSDVFGYRMLLRNQPWVAVMISRIDGSRTDFGDYITDPEQDKPIARGKCLPIKKAF